MTGRTLNLAPEEFLVALQMLLAMRTGKLEFGHRIRAVFALACTKRARSAMDISVIQTRRFSGSDAA
jgi:hypothetical protein